MSKFEAYTPYALVVISIVLMFFIMNVAAEREFTTLESVVLQYLILSTGLLGSYLLGRRTSKELVQETVRPHARSAFRRLMSLYKSISSVVSTIDTSELETEREKLAVIRAMVIAQLVTADDALEDWQDLDPDSVKEIRSKLNGADKETTIYE